MIDIYKPGVRSMGPDVTERGFADLTDVTLALDFFPIFLKFLSEMFKCVSISRTYPVPYNRYDPHITAMIHNITAGAP